jgi:hypothetical protein
MLAKGQQRGFPQVQPWTASTRGQFCVFLMNGQVRNRIAML